MTMRLTYFILCAAAVLAVSLVSPTAQAQSADALIQQGLDLRRQQRDAEALQHFQDAYNLNHSAQALAQIALAEQALGNYVEAEVHLQQALAVRGDAWIEARRPQLTQAAQQIGAQLGTVELSGGVPGAQVYVNGIERGTLPAAARIRLRAGSAVIEIRAQGYVPVQRSVMVAAGGTARESIQLIPAAGGQVQVQAQGGPVVQPQPRYTGYQQPQTRYEEQANLRLFWAGLPVFLAPFLITGVTGYIAHAGSSTDDLAPMGFIPVAGPFIYIDTADVDFTVGMLALSGIAQAAGIVLMVLGFTTTREVEVRASLGDGPQAPTLTFLPAAGPEYVGGSLALNHF
ncbi:MAG TPA: carboxypeptidase regulatory-like domain-containing protein [Polyangiaceae bacterium]|nr:carboxypeptidase regulatory-like domain-containing protein [Polyangiaceae bacterium]